MELVQTLGAGHRDVFGKSKSFIVYIHALFARNILRKNDSANIIYGNTLNVTIHYFDKKLTCPNVCTSSRVSPQAVDVRCSGVELNINGSTSP